MTGAAFHFGVNDGINVELAARRLAAQMQPVGNHGGKLALEAANEGALFDFSLLRPIGLRVGNDFGLKKTPVPAVIRFAIVPLGIGNPSAGFVVANLKSKAIENNVAAIDGARAFLGPHDLGHVDFPESFRMFLPFVFAVGLATLPGILFDGFNLFKSVYRQVRPGAIVILGRQHFDVGLYFALDFGSDRVVAFRFRDVRYAHIPNGRRPRKFTGKLAER